MLSLEKNDTSWITERELDLLIYDQVWCKAKHLAVTLLARPPAQTERHEEKPGALQQSHLIIQVQIPET